MTRRTDIIAMETRDEGWGDFAPEHERLGRCVVVATHDGDVSEEEAVAVLQAGGYEVIPSPAGLRIFSCEHEACSRIGGHRGDAGNYRQQLDIGAEGREGSSEPRPCARRAQSHLLGVPAGALGRCRRTIRRLDWADARRRPSGCFELFRQ